MRFLTGRFALEVHWARAICVAVYETFGASTRCGVASVTADQLEVTAGQHVRRLTDWCIPNFPADCHFEDRRQCGRMFEQLYALCSR